MTINGALANALAGLRVTGRASEVVANNLANLLTPGYGVRELEIAAGVDGVSGRVHTVGLVRLVDEGLISDRRLMSAEAAERISASDFLAGLAEKLGTPGQDGSLSGFYAGLESALVTAASRPDAADRLALTATAARDLAIGINRASDHVQKARSDAERAIGSQVEHLNASLQQVEKLNTRIRSAAARGEDTASLMDMRQQVVDDIAKMVPLRSIPRDRGTIALYSTGGAILVDGRAATVEFTPTNTVTAYQTIGAGMLSGLSINGNPIETGSDRSPLRGGSLIAQFAIRDETGVAAQTQLDALARDLIERFQDPAVDPTLTPGDPGLFTDQGGAFDPTNETGLSARISLNALVDPAQGGEVWRLRDGLGAAVPGAEGNARLLNALSDALTKTHLPASGDFGTGLFSASDVVAAFTSRISTERIRADQTRAFAMAQLTELKQAELAEGVDSDAELQRLIVIEQAYAANARIIQTAEQMMDAILRI